MGDNVTKKCAIMTAENHIDKIEYLIVRVQGVDYHARAFKLDGWNLTYTDMETGAETTLTLNEIDNVWIRWPKTPPTTKMLACIQAMIEVAAEEIGYTCVGGELELVLAEMKEYTLERAVWAVERWKDATSDLM